MNRNFELESRINKIQKYDILNKVNSYGAMGMDGISDNVKKLRLEELDYMRNHPEIYKNKMVNNDSKMYLIRLK